MLLSWFYESSDQAAESLYPFYILNFNCFMELVNFCLVCWWLINDYLLYQKMPPVLSSLLLYGSTLPTNIQAGLYSR